jgi:histidinol-phosphate aminotransferase
VNIIHRLVRPDVSKISPYGPGKSANEVKRELGLDRVLKLASNENPLGPSPKAMSAIFEMSADVHTYPDAKGFDLKNKLAAKYGLSPHEVILGNGSEELLMLLGQVFINAGDKVVMGRPTFPIYSISTLLMGGVPVEVPVTNLGSLDLEAMLNNITPGTKMVFLCNPNNPTGGMVTKQEVREFMDRISPDVLVVADEAYAEYVDDPDYGDFLPYVKEGRNVIVLHTFSKIYGLAGLRVGYGLATQDICALIERVKPCFNQNVFAQVAAVAALDDHDHVRKSLKNNHAGKRYLTSELTAIGCKVYPSWGNFLLVDTGIDCQVLFEQMLKRGVIVRPATPWELPTCLRITIGTPDENGVLIDEMKLAMAGV